MNIDAIVDELMNEKVIVPDILNVEKLKGGTLSQIFLIKESTLSKKVIKINDPPVLKAESFFLQTYKHLPILANLLYTEAHNKYMVYSYVPGEINPSMIRKETLLKMVVQTLINRYEPIDTDNGWGWVQTSTDSWNSFLKNWTIEADEWIAAYIPHNEKEVMYRLIDDPARNQSSRTPYLLHGDCGFHNCLVMNDNLEGIIDPMPVVGYPIYDLVYAFCSTPDSLNRETIEPAAGLLKVGNEMSKQTLYEEVLIGLYFRIARCIKHHPQDLPIYLNAWSYWYEIVVEDSICGQSTVW